MAKRVTLKLSLEEEMSEEFRNYWQNKTDSGHRFKDEFWYSKLAEELLHLFPVRGTLLDVGCGDAKILTHLAPHFDNVIGIDISDVMLGQAKKRVNECGISNIRFEQADACHFPDSVGKADLILSYGVAQYLEPKEISGYLRECKRVLNQGGMVGICTIPWANLKYLYRLKGLRDKALSPQRAILRYYLHIPRMIYSRIKRGVMADGIGLWYTHNQIKDIACAEGFNCEIVTSWYYEYRFHAILNPSNT